MPIQSPAQGRLMMAAAHTPGGYDGVPQSVGREFVDATPHAKLSQAMRGRKQHAKEGQGDPASDYKRPGGDY